MVKVDDRKSHSMGLHCVFMTQKDWSDFAALLSREFPRLRYLDRDYWKDFLDRVAMAKRAERLRRLRDQTIHPVIMKDPGRSPPVFSRIYPAGRYHVTEAWPVPAGWRARWLPPSKHGYRYIANRPESFLEIVATTSVEFAPNHRGDGDERRCLSMSSFCGYWPEGSETGRRFVKRAFRLLNRETTRLFLWLDEETLKPLDPVPSAAPHFRAGRDATAWVSCSPSRYCQGFVRPVWVEKPTCSARNAASAPSSHRAAATRPDRKSDRRGGRARS